MSKKIDSLVVVGCILLICVFVLYALHMQKNCGNKSFGHKESFSLECNGCCE